MIKKKSFVDTVVKFLISSFIIFIVLIPVLIVRTVGKIFKKDLIKFNQDKERGKYSQWMFDTWLSEKEKAQNNRVFVYFLFPSLFSFSLFVVLPFFQGLYYSLTDWTGLNTGDEALVGILNYITIFRDYGFAYSFIRTVIYSVLNIVAINLIAFTLAMIVVQKLKFKNVYRAAFFMPNLIG